MHFVIEALRSTQQPAKSVRLGRPGLLTKREEGVVHLVAEGLTNRDISHQLNLSEHTVRNYLFRIFNKVGTSNRLELALYAIDRRGGLAGSDELLPVTNQPRSSMDEGKTPWTECKNIARA
jgi:DNA-binding NarL/FixJ family response regulator